MIWLFSPAWDAVKLTLKVGSICTFQVVVDDPTYFLFHAAQAPVPSIPMHRGTATPLARDGLTILGAPIGTSAYCMAQIRKTITSIQRDLDLLSKLDHRHQRTKLALYCCNSRIMYLLRALPLEVVQPELPHLDQIFKTFVASTVWFKEGTLCPAMQLATKTLRVPPCS